MSIPTSHAENFIVAGTDNNVYVYELNSEGSTAIFVGMVTPLCNAETIQVLLWSGSVSKKLRTLYLHSHIGQDMDYQAGSGTLTLMYTSPAILAVVDVPKMLSVVTPQNTQNHPCGKGSSGGLVGQGVSVRVFTSFDVQATGLAGTPVRTPTGGIRIEQGELQAVMGDPVVSFKDNPRILRYGGVNNQFEADPEASGSGFGNCIKRQDDVGNRAT